MRKGVIPGKTRAQIKAELEEKNKIEKLTLLQKSSWARLLARVFDIDISKCSCGGNLKIISAIRDPFAIKKILNHLGLSHQPPPIAPARYQEVLLHILKNSLLEAQLSYCLKNTKNKDLVKKKSCQWKI